MPPLLVVYIFMKITSPHTIYKRRQALVKNVFRQTNVGKPYINGQSEKIDGKEGSNTGKL